MTEGDYFWGVEPVNMDRAFTEVPSEIDFVLPGMIAGTVGSLIAQGGAGKSWLALEIAVAVAGGPDLVGMGIDRVGKVLYLPAEDPAPALAHRLFNLASHLSETDKEEIQHNLSIIPMIGSTIDLMDSGWANSLREFAKDQRLIIIDTLRRFHTEDENASGPMAVLLGVMESICKETGSSILFLHHTTKGASLNGQGADQQASRGSSVLVDNIRGGQWNLLPLSDAEIKRHKIDPALRRGYVKLTQSKANFGPIMADKILMRDTGGILLPSMLETETNGTFNRQSPELKSRQGRERGEDG